MEQAREREKEREKARDEEKATEKKRDREKGPSKHSNYFSKETSADGALPFKANMAE